VLGLLALAGFCALAAMGVPSPSDVLLAGRAAEGGPGVLPAFLAAWIGYSVGDALAVPLLRFGVARRLPARWQAKVQASRLSAIDARFVFVSRLLPASFVVNAAVAAGRLPYRKFLPAAVAGEFFYALFVTLVGLGGGTIVRAFLPQVIITVVTVIALWVLLRVRYVRRGRRQIVVEGDAPPARRRRLRRWGGGGWE
jgi:membrane protein DedA with SNARE-associated domain